jgi:ABC-type phosphate/phosphonate transport system substrate-binding protein
LYLASIGPLLTPRRVIEAILSGAIDIGPLDSYFHDLLSAHEPETARQLRIVDTTSPRPIPLLVAARMADGDMVMALRSALVCIGDDAVGRDILAKLRLTGFADIIPDAYSILTREAEKAEKAGYFQPG